MDRCRKQKEFTLYCIVDEAWTLKGAAQFDFKIKDGVFSCRVIAENERQAQTIVANQLPVIQFLEKPSE